MGELETRRMRIRRVELGKRPNDQQLTALSFFCPSPYLTDLIGSEMQDFIISRKGGIHLIHNQHTYRSNLKRSGANRDIIYWECIRNRDIKCKVRLKSVGDSLYLSNVDHRKTQSTFLGVACL